MKLDIFNYDDLTIANTDKLIKLEKALEDNGIIGIRGVPEFEVKCRHFVDAARIFSKLPEEVKHKYVPDRDMGQTEGYELGAEWFKTKEGKWQIDDKKASFYAIVPDDNKNIWPTEVDLQNPYLALGNLIFEVGKLLLNSLVISKRIGLTSNLLSGYGRMLHYQKEDDSTLENPNWCGEHFDHGVFTGLIPAYYYSDDKEIDEPEEAGLYIRPTDSKYFEKINAQDKSILLFQVGEFGQLASNDAIKATKHIVKKANGNIERFTFALFNSAHDDFSILSSSSLTSDERYALNKSKDGSIKYGDWQQASYERYRATVL